MTHVPGGELYYEVAGEGPAVVLVHAGIADCRMWDHQLPALAERYRVIRYDTRGFGRTHTEEVAFSNRHDLIALLDAFGIVRAALVGVSRGGQIALDTALEFPERVAALVPICAGISGYEHPESQISAAELALFTAMEAAEQQQDWPRVAALDVRLWVDGPEQLEGRADPEVRRRVYEMSLNNYTTVTVFGKAEPLEPPAFARLEQIEGPTLMISTDLDTSVAQAAAAIMAERIPNAGHVVMYGAAHMPNMEQPAEFNRVLLEFFQTSLAR